MARGRWRQWRVCGLRVRCLQGVGGVGVEESPTSRRLHVAGAPGKRREFLMVTTTFPLAFHKKKMPFVDSLQRYLATRTDVSGSEAIAHAKGFVDALALNLGDDESAIVFAEVADSLSGDEATPVDRLEVDALVYAARVLVTRARGPARDRVALFARSCGGELSGPGLVHDVCTELGREGLEDVRIEAVAALEERLDQRRRWSRDWDETQERQSLRACQRVLRLLEACGGWAEVVSYCASVFASVSVCPFVKERLTG